MADSKSHFFYFMKEKIMNTQRHESGEFFYGFNDGAPLDDVADGTDESTTEEDVVEDDDGQPSEQQENEDFAKDNEPEFSEEDSEK